MSEQYSGHLNRVNAQGVWFIGSNLEPAPTSLSVGCQADPKEGMIPLFCVYLNGGIITEIPLTKEQARDLADRLRRMADVN